MLRSLGPLVGCGLMLLVCMAVMAVMGRGGRKGSEPASPSSDEVAELRAEVARLRDLDERRARAEETAP